MEKVRTVALGMHRPDDLLDVCKVLFRQLLSIGFFEIRNAMAMHKSEELAEAAQVLFHQLRELGGIPDRIAIGVVDESTGVVNFWSTDQSGSHIDKSFKARLSEKKVMAKTYQAWKDHKKSLVIDLHG